jgi:predicted RNA-binding protein (virulence factor B family)
MSYKPGAFLNLFVINMNSFEVTLEDREQNQYFMPSAEQAHKLSVGNEIMTVLFDDGSGLFASMRLEKHANHDLSGLKPGQKVDLFIISESPLGYKCIVDGEKIGMLYKNEVFQQLRSGEQTIGYISKMREDKKIDLLLRAPGHHATQDIGEKILEELKKAGGFLAINDKTSPEKIYEIFGASKKKYKMALGGLYKSRLITVSDEGITLTK